MRILVYSLLRVRDAYLLQHINRICPSLACTFSLMELNGLDNLIAYRIDRIETCHRLLKNHSNFISTNGTHSLLAEFKQISIAKHNLPSNNRPRRRRHQSYNRKRGNTFSAAAFTDKRKRPSLLYRKGNSLHSVCNAPLSEEINRKSFNF